MGFNGLVFGGVVCGVFSVVMAFLGLWGPGFVNHTLSDQIDATLVVTSTEDKGYDDWTTEHTDQVPMYRYMYFFHIDNHDGVYAGEKPRMVEMGPYVYREYRHRFNATWERSGDIIAFRKYASFVYEPSLSCPGCDPKNTTITVPNIPMVGLGATVVEKAGSGFWQRLAASIATAPEEVLTNRTVHEMAFGYTDPVLAGVAQAVAKFTNSSGGGDAPPAVETGFPGISPNQTNETYADPGLMKTYTGKHNNTLIQWITEWSSLTDLGVWGTEEWNRVYGSSDGSQFTRNVERSDRLFAFVDTLFITVPLLYEGDVTLHGIDLYRYGIDNATYANATEVPDNAGKYLFGPSGVFNMTRAQGGVPIFLSKPHFLDADRYYVDNLEGVEPVRSLHDTIVDVEPITGNTMRARQRLQLNVKLEPMLVYGQSIRPTLIPVGWIDEASALTPSLAREFRNSVYLFRDIGRYGGWACLGLAVLLGMCSALLAWRAVGKSRRGKGPYESPGSNTPLMGSKSPRGEYTLYTGGSKASGEIEAVLINPSR